MIIECDFCESKVDSKIVASHSFYHEGLEEVYGPPYGVYLLECSSCGQTLVAGQFINERGDPFNWSKISRLWPDPEKDISEEIPQGIRNSLEEANKCFKSRACLATVVMCGRVLEGICVHFKTKHKNLAGGLKELLETGIIDKRIYTWSEALREHRNIGAHFSDKKINVEDAHDLLDFVNAICEYVFILNNKFEKFMTRKKKGEISI